MLTGNEQDWHADKQRFADPDATGETLGLGPLALQFAALTGSLLQVKSVGDVLQHVVDAALVVIPNVDVASVTIRNPEGVFHTPVYSDEVAVRLDELQYELGEGPCVDAAIVDGPGAAESVNLHKDNQWPKFSREAVELGICAVLTTALYPEAIGQASAAALNLYTRRPRGFEEYDRAAALLLVTHASLALAHTSAVTAADLQATQLRAAIDSRDVIGQAKGILMARRQLSADDAFDLLRRASQELNIKLANVAATVAAQHQQLDLSDGRPQAPTDFAEK
ncbi:GAF and ANTAR domain-containing protein [Skermania sp. ID1734]|uniref:GAF and ANTAR domain-containing protein n=1 Tax=Skermania sp. ID1734 TaxID=2597516 RepID=UPI001C8F4A4C|nr:GAF and ANTAR domain-containing protein [Skermania sp. ID1734]